MAWGDKNKVERMVLEGEFECLLCPHIEKNVKYLASKNGAFCRDCGVSLYYWPNANTVRFNLSVDHSQYPLSFECTV